MPHGITIRVDDTLTLRTLELRDATALFALTETCREYLREWLPWLDATQTVDDTKAFIEGTLRQLAASNGFQTAIWNNEQLVGIIGYHRMDWANRSTSVGYWLGKQFQGKGTMTRSCRALVQYAFYDLGLHRVEIRCAVENKKSRAIPERLGFYGEGTLRDAEWLYDHFVNHIVYGMLEHEWRELQTARRSQNLNIQL